VWGSWVGEKRIDGSTVLQRWPLLIETFAFNVLDLGIGYREPFRDLGTSGENAHPRILDLNQGAEDRLALFDGEVLGVSGFRHAVTYGLEGGQSNNAYDTKYRPPRYDRTPHNVARATLHSVRVSRRTPMPLLDFHLQPVDEPIPADVIRFIAEADRRIEKFQEDARIPGFVASDYALAYRLLRDLSASTFARGRQFCEWGSGFGVVTCLAAMLDFDACGIEIENELVDEARQLAADFELPAEFIQGSFVPRGAERRVYAAGVYSWFTTDGDHAYDELGLDPNDLDVVFAYPWPDEEAVTAELFEWYAGNGAVLATYHGTDGIRFRRKSGKRRKK